MHQRLSLYATAAFGLTVLGLAAVGSMSSGVLAQAPAARQAVPAAAPAAAPAPAPTRPALLFREEWNQPPYTGTLNDENRRVTQDAVGNPNLELKLYGTAVKEVGVYSHENRLDLWTGMATSPVAMTLRDKRSFVDLTGLARLRWTVRSQGLHAVHPVVKLADGSFLVGNRSQSTDGEYVTSEVVFTGMRWYKLDPGKVVTTVEVKSPDLSKVDEIGFADLMPSGGHGNAGWINVSAVELYARPVPR